MTLSRSRSTVYLQSDVASKLPRAYSSSNLTSWTTKPYDPSWRCPEPYDDYGRFLNTYIPTYLSKYYRRQNYSDDFWYPSYLSTRNSLRYGDRAPTYYIPRQRMYGGLRYNLRYDYPFSYNYYTRYPLYSFYWYGY